MANKGASRGVNSVEAAENGGVERISTSHGGIYGEDTRFTGTGCRGRGQSRESLDWECGVCSGALKYKDDDSLMDGLELRDGGHSQRERIRCRNQEESRGVHSKRNWS
jgi:hypothetical protein